MSEDKQNGNEPSKKDGKNGGGNEPPPPTIVEWGARVIGGLFLLGLIAFTVNFALETPQPVSIAFEEKMDEVEIRDGNWLLPIIIRNESNRSLLDLSLTVELRDGAGEVLDEAPVQISLLGHGQALTVHIWFAADPRSNEIHYNVDGYKLP